MMTSPAFYELDRASLNKGKGTSKALRSVTIVLCLLFSSGCSNFLLRSVSPSLIYDFPEEHRVESLPALQPERARSRILVLGDIGVNAGCYPYRYGRHAKACSRLHEDVLAVLNEARGACVDEGGGRCDVAVLLGDNVYDAGVEDKAKEEFLFNLLAAVHMTSRNTLVVLGNHDWGSATELVLRGHDKHRRALAQLRLLASARAARLGVLSSTLFWGINVGSARLVGIDAQYLSLTHQGDEAAAQEKRKVVEDALMQIKRHAAPSSWRIAFGHHNYLSDGRGHGDVGESYRWLGAAGVGYKGSYFQQFMDESIVSAFDLYATGHEHSLQFFNEIKVTGKNGRPGAAQLLVGSSGKVNAELRTPSEVKSSRGYTSDYARAVLSFAILEVSPLRLSVSGYGVHNSERGHCRGLEFVSEKVGSASASWTRVAHQSTSECR